MDALAENHLNIDTIKYSDITGKGKEQITFDYVPLDQALKYAAQDADITFKLYEHFMQRLYDEQMMTFYEVIERNLPIVISQIERNGVGISAVSYTHLTLPTTPYV